jgi:DNA helicase II / ATP-dependent DNA helicase PcrA
MVREYELRSFPTATELRMDYARELNAQQYAAVTAAPGPSLVIAGAGAGKTRTLTYRVAYLIEQGVPADRLLLLTFTNKAAKEMMHRVTELLSHDLRAIWGGTFHSVGNRILRRHAAGVGYREDFTILDREDARDLIDACIGEAKIDVKATRFPKAEVLSDLFSLAVNMRQGIPGVLSSHFDYFRHLEAEVEEIGKRYQARKRAANVMDFDDLLALWLRLMQEQAEVGELYQRRFQFLLVDEYQDTNKLQSDLIDWLAARHRNVMVVGDDAQSIYSWRGANFQNILDFPRRYPDAQVFKIETNYRSTPEILSMANSAIAGNTQQFAKQLVPVRPSGIKPVLVVCGTAGEQAAFVAQRILELREEGTPLDRMAVLYRAHYHAMELQMELTRRNIPFSITSGIRFFEQAHIKDVAAFLKWVGNPRDELAFKRQVQLLPGIGGKGADRIWSACSAVPRDRDGGLRPVLEAARDKVPKKAAAAWSQWVETVVQISTAPVYPRPAEMIQCVMEAVYRDYLQEQYDNYRDRLDDLEQLAAFARQFPELEEFLTQLSLLSNVETEANVVRDAEGQIHLSTIHQAKGLEYDVVFLIMLCEGLFPAARSLERREKEEEERRLFYVGITRARNELYLSYPLIRITAGYGGDLGQKPSRFLQEIPVALREEWGLRPGSSAGDAF